VSDSFAKMPRQELLIAGEEMKASNICSLSVWLNFSFLIVFTIKQRQILHGHSYPGLSGFLR